MDGGVRKVGVCMRKFWGGRGGGEWVHGLGWARGGWGWETEDGEGGRKGGEVGERGSEVVMEIWIRLRRRCETL